MKKPRTLDLVLLLIWPIVATVIVLVSKIDVFSSFLIYAGIPSLYLSLRAKENVDKALIFSMIGLPMAIVFQYLAVVSKSWTEVDTVFPFMFFGLVSIEMMLWGVLMAYFIVMFYEYFIHKHATKKMWQPRLKYLALIWVISLGIFAVFFFTLPAQLNVPYFYLIFGMVIILIPIAIELFKQPNLISKFTKAGAYFFYFFFIYEVTSLQLNHWDFPGPYFIGWIQIFNVAFPIEELVFFVILFAVAILTYYQFFDDYQK